MSKSEVLVHEQGKYRVTLVDSPLEADGPFKQTHVLGVEDYHFRNEHSVYIEKNGEVISTCLLRAGGGKTAVYPSSGFIHGDRFITCIGDYVCALELPSLNLIWQTKTDCFTCFGIYHSSQHNCYISHGELKIARLNNAGDIEWTASGPDIFTGSLYMREDHIEVEDWNDDLWAFSIEDGKEIKI